MLDNLADLLAMWIEFIDALVEHAEEMEDELEDRIWYLFMGRMMPK